MFVYPHGYMKASGGGAPPTGPWEYASLAIAEASGDPWQDGQDVQITGGALFVYKSALAINSYSGLIHKYPYDGLGTLGTLSTATPRGSAAPNTDPDTWTDFTITKSLTADADVFGGRSRLYAGSTEASVSIITATETGGLGVSDNETFMVLKDVNVTYSDSGASQFPTLARIILGAAVDASNRETVELRHIRTANWRIYHGSITTTTIAPTSQQRLWVYVKAGRWAVWVSDESVPRHSGTLPKIETGLGTMQYLSAINNSYIKHTSLLLTQNMVGVMETA